MADKLKPLTKAWKLRQERWRHNSYLGHAAMMKANARAIYNSSTATDEAAGIAFQIERLAEKLTQALKIRCTSDTPS